MDERASEVSGISCYELMESRVPPDPVPFKNDRDFPHLRYALLRLCPFSFFLSASLLPFPRILFADISRTSEQDHPVYTQMARLDVRVKGLVLFKL